MSLDIHMAKCENRKELEEILKNYKGYEPELEHECLFYHAYVLDDINTIMKAIACHTTKDYFKVRHCDIAYPKGAFELEDPEWNEVFKDHERIVNEFPKLYDEKISKLTLKEFEKEYPLEFEAVCDQEDEYKQEYFDKIMDVFKDINENIRKGYTIFYFM